MGNIGLLTFFFALIYTGFVCGVLIDRLFLRPKPEIKKATDSNPESGSVFTMLLVGIGMAAAISVVLYQTVSGPMSSMVRVTNKTGAKSQMQSVSNIVIMDAINQANGGDCDADGSVEPRAWRVGAYGPTGGGLIPLTIGAPVTDPWGTDYGYCVWDVGTQIKIAGCDGANGPNAQRRSGSPTPSAGNALSQSVVAIISAGPNRQFESTCRDYANATIPADANTDVIVTGGDDIVKRFTYTEAASATSSLWTLKPSDSTSAVINKNLAIGPTATPTVTVNSTTGLISALGITTQGKISSGGAIQLADNTAVTSCVAANIGDMRFNATSKTMEICDGAGNWNGSSSALSGLTAAKASNTIANVNFAQVWNWDTLTTQTALKLGSTSMTTGSVLEVANTNAGQTGAALKVAGKLNVVPVTGAAAPFIGNGSLTYTLPASDGTAGYQLTTNGAGTLSWAVAGPSSQWTTTGSDIYYNTGNVGIGTTGPLAKLHVNGRIRSSNTQPGEPSIELMTTGVKSWNINLPNSNQRFAINEDASTERFTILSGGNVGIGTASPTRRLHVVGDTGFAAEIDQTRSDSNGLIVNIPNTTVSQDILQLQANSLIKVAVNGAGNVGIGTASPGAKLQVSGKVAIDPTNTTSRTPLDDIDLFHGNAPSYDFGLRMSNSGGNDFRMLYSYTGAYGYFTSMGFSTGVPDTLSIGANGNVGIGTTSPVRRLEVVSQYGAGATVNGSGWAMAISYGGAGTQYGLTLAPKDSSTSTWVVHVGNAAGGTAGGITADNTSTTFNTTSDERLKENIVDSTKGLSAVLALKVRDFNFIADPKKKRQQGFVAQELYKTYPAAVTVGGDNPAILPWGVDYGRLTPLLVRSIQELKAGNDVVEARVDKVMKRCQFLVTDLIAPITKSTQEIVAKFNALEKTVDGLVTRFQPLEQTVHQLTADNDTLRKDVADLKAAMKEIRRARK